MVICFKNVILSLAVCLLVTMKAYRFGPASTRSSSRLIHKDEDFNIWATSYK